MSSSVLFVRKVYFMKPTFSTNYFGTMSAIINCFTDGFGTICYIKKSDEKIINFKSDIFCNEWDAFKKDDLTYSKCISLISKEFILKDERERFIRELSIKNILDGLQQSPFLVYDYHLKKGNEILHYSARIVFSPDDGIIIGLKALVNNTQSALMMMEAR